MSQLLCICVFLVFCMYRHLDEREDRCASKLAPTTHRQLYKKKIQIHTMLTVARHFLKLGKWAIIHLDD
jgi:hypothetical protein